MSAAIYAENPSFVISLDFELHWGILDHTPVDNCRPVLLGAREAVKRLLDIFEKHSIRATWATVGALFCDGLDELVHRLREDPAYKDPNLGIKRHLGILGDSEKSDPFHFAPSLIREIIRTPGQELATHTFAHIYGCEDGVSEMDFQLDMEVALQIAEEWGQSIKSLVFPRNQFNPRMLTIAENLGIETYRGTPKNWAWSGSPEVDLGQRAIRLVDSFTPIAFPCPVVRTSNPVDVPATLFFRSDVPRMGRGFVLDRVEAGLRHAALHGGTFHLWWHPHNFGTDINYSMSLLEEVLAIFGRLRDEYGMQSHAMGDFRKWTSMSTDSSLEGATA